jgi:RHS repeat-associated protein
MLTGHNGQVVERYEYDVYGVAYNGKFDHGLAGIGGNPYGFTGKRYEPVMGIYSFAFRDYNPQNMRWMTPDPIKDGLNWYQYCGSDPVNWVDLLGLCGEEPDPRGTLTPCPEIYVAINKETGDVYGYHTKTGGVSALPLTKEEIIERAHDNPVKFKEFGVTEDYELEFKYKQGVPEIVNPTLEKALKDVGEKLEAHSVYISESQRTEKQHKAIMDDGLTKASYKSTQHSSYQGYKAADVKYYNKDGKQINNKEVAEAAELVDEVGGIGVYNTHVHIDVRDRKPDGSVYKW